MSVQDSGDELDEIDQQPIIDTNPARLIITNEGTLDPSLLVRTEGYMYKKGGAVNARGGFRNWKKRWFVLEPVEFFGYGGYELKYYDAPNGTLKGSVSLNDVDLYCEPKSENKKVKYEFQINLQNGSILQLSCDDEQERQEWIDTLSVIIAFFRKVTVSSAMALDGYDPLYEDDEESYKIGDELAQACQVFGPGLFGSEAGKAANFMVQVYDLAGQKVEKGGMPITATIEGEGCLYYIAMIDNEDGSYLAQYTIGRSGKYQLNIKLNDEHHVFGSPYDIEILPSKTIPKYCIAEGEALQKVKIRGASIFTIIAKDGFGNKKNRGGDPFEVGVMGAAQLMDLNDNGDGTYTCSVEAIPNVNLATSPTLMILVTLYGKPISASPFKPILVDVAGNPPSAPPSSSASFASHAMASLQSARQATAAESIQPPPTRMRGAPSSQASLRSAPPVPPSVSSTRSVPREITVPASVAESKVSSQAPPPPVPQMETVSPSRASMLGQAKLPDVQAATSPMDRLERSRQRAMMAKALFEQQQTVTASPTKAAGDQVNRFGLSDLAASNTAARQTAGPAVTLNTSNARASKLSQLAEKNKEILNAKMSGSIPSPKKDEIPVMKTATMQELAIAIKQGLGKTSSLADSASQFEHGLWNGSQQAFNDNTVVEMFCNNADILFQVFALFADRVEGISVIKLVTTRGHGGMLRLLELYEIIPNFCTKNEAKTVFGLIALAQRNLKSPAASAGGGGGLDFPFFLKFLFMIAQCALTKSAAFSDAYSTSHAKMDVLLNKWGFADMNKLRAIRNVLSNVEI